MFVQVQVLFNLVYIPCSPAFESRVTSKNLFGGLTREVEDDFHIGIVDMIHDVIVVALVYYKVNL